MPFPHCLQGGTQSYLTSPLVASNGHRLGAICIMDTKPRTFAATDCRLMNNFSELAVRGMGVLVRMKHERFALTHAMLHEQCVTTDH